MAKAVSKEQQEQLVLAHLINIHPKSATTRDIAEATGLDDGVVKDRLKLSVECGFAVKQRGRYVFIGTSGS